jgi:hypothetical protein
LTSKRVVILGNLLKGKLKYSLLDSRGPEVIDFPQKDMHGGADVIIVQDLAECIDKGTQPKASGEEGFRSAIVCLAIDEARRSGTVVDLEPIWQKFAV